MGKRGPKSQFKTKRKKRQARKDTQKRWYEKNSKKHIENVIQRRHANRGLSAELITNEDNSSEVSESDHFHKVTGILEQIRKDHASAFGFRDMRSLGRNWLAQVTAVETDEEEEVLLCRAGQLKDVADSLAVRISPCHATCA
ncbi:hypothetical protein M422DRAFT_778055 [Sphaerobolus stellatus SS14]|nr:hypothetical protein M422DRAFT_778055 [Sphaerobolus stellatus SS14]